MLQPPTVIWECVSNYAATRDIHHCLYVLYNANPSFENRPYYIGKAKRLGGVAKSRYNPGYGYLIDGLLLSGFKLFVARLSPTHFEKAEHYEEYLIQEWNPIRNRRRGRFVPWLIDANRPW